MKTAAENEQEFLKSREDDRKKALAHMRQAFEHMDNDKSGSISVEEYHKAITENEEVMVAFQELGLHEEEDLFSTLDAEKIGHVTFDQFFDGVTLVMKGHETAKAKDMVGTHLVCAAIARRAKKIESDLSHLWHKDSQLVNELKLMRGLAPNSKELANMKLDLEEKNDPMFAVEPLKDATGSSHRPNQVLRVSSPVRVAELSSPVAENSGGNSDSRCYGVCSGDVGVPEVTNSAQSALYATFQKILDSTEALSERLESVESQLDLQGQQIEQLMTTAS